MTVKLVRDRFGPTINKRQLNIRLRNPINEPIV